MGIRRGPGLTSDEGAAHESSGIYEVFEDEVGSCRRGNTDSLSRTPPGEGSGYQSAATAMPENSVSSPPPFVQSDTAIRQPTALNDPASIVSSGAGVESSRDTNVSLRAAEATGASRDERDCKLAEHAVAPEAGAELDEQNQDDATHQQLCSQHMDADAEDQDIATESRIAPPEMYAGTDE